MHQSTQTEKEFITLIQKHEGILHKICFVYAKNDADKEDLYQEIILQLWKSYTSFEGKSKFSTWMYRVALNTAITLARKPRMFEKPGNEIPGSYEFESKMDYSEDVKILYKSISQLKKVEKAIVLLWLEEKSYTEIGEAVGISDKNVGVKLGRIKSKLAEIIKSLS